LELNGSLRARFKSGAIANITCFADGTLPVTVEVHSKAQRYVVLEAERKALFLNAEKNWVRKEKDAKKSANPDFMSLEEAKKLGILSDGK